MKFRELYASILIALYDGKTLGYWKRYSELRRMPWFTHDRGWWQ